MRNKLLGALVFISCAVHAQQVNPVPDYVFQNRMSVGRTTVTDTLAYFSMGPRYGAIRGFMPPMVVDTALVTGGTKRNGLTIFSIQKNKYVYWDSVGSKWAEMAGTGGSAINSGDTASMLSPYTRGSGTTNYVPKFTGTRTFGNSQIFDNGTNVAIGTTNFVWAASNRKNLEINGTSQALIGLNISDTTGGYIWQNGVDMTIVAQNAGYIQFGTNGNSTRMRIKSDGEILVGGSADAGAYTFQVAGNLYNTAGAVFAATSGEVLVNSTFSVSTVYKLQVNSPIYATGYNLSGGGYYENTNTTDSKLGNNNATLVLERVSGNFVFNNGGTGEILLGTGTDAGAYRLQVAGSIYNTTGAVLAASSGNVGIGTTSPGFKLDVDGILRGNYITSTTEYRINNATFSRIAKIDGTGGGFAGGYNADISTGVVSHAETGAINAFHYAGNNVGIRFFSDSSRAAGTVATVRMIIVPSGNVGIGTTSPTERLHVNGNILTADPAGGTAKPWRLGEAATVSPTSPNRTIRVEIDGTVYYIHAKTTND